MNDKSILTERKPSWKRTVVELLLTFLGSLLNILGYAAAFWGYLGLAIKFTPYLGGFLSPEGVDMTITLLAVISALVLLPGSFLIISLYLSRSRRGWAAGFWALVVYIFSLFIAYEIASALHINNLFGLEFGIGSCLSMAVLLGVSGRVKSRSQWLGLGLGLVIGILPYIIANPLTPYQTAFGFVWIWLSAVFFPELIDRRVGWQGILVWVGLMFISPSLAQVIIHLTGLD